jgi:CRISPR-associated protein Csm4
MKIVWLIPRSGYVTDLRSVTIWGTLCWGIRYLWGESELEDFIARHQTGVPDLIVSSAFPFKQQGKKRTPFFPNPLVSPPDLDWEESIPDSLTKYRLKKKLKDLEFLSLEDFQEVLHGRLTETDLLDRQLNEYNRKKKHDEEQCGQMFKKDYFPNENFIAQIAPTRHENSMTHNTIDRLRGGTLNLKDEDGNLSGQLFHADDIWWSDPYDESESGEPKTGLFFLVDGTEECIEKYLKPTMRFLRHWGIGADRTAGKGVFDFEIEEFDLGAPKDTESNAQLNLSIFLPEKRDLDFFEAHPALFQYALENRECKGWSGSGGFDKNPVLFFKEGSIFPKPLSISQRSLGRIYQQELGDNAPGHKVYDNGISLMVNITWKSPKV